MSTPAVSAAWDIRVDDLSGSAIIELLREHLRCMREVSPPESVHALNLEELGKPNITFWSIWSGPNLAGCGALKELDVEHGEIKSMRTACAYQKKDSLHKCCDTSWKKRSAGDTAA